MKMTRLDRALLVLGVVFLAAMTGIHTFGILQSLKNDTALVEEAEKLRQEMDDTQRIINNARDISEASVDFWRCAFLIQPDVEKTPDVIDACIEEAQFPARMVPRR